MGRRIGCSLMKEQTKLIVVEKRKDEGKAEMDVRVLRPTRNTSSQKPEKPVEKEGSFFTI